MATTWHKRRKRCLMIQFWLLGANGERCCTEFLVSTFVHLPEVSLLESFTVEGTRTHAHADRAHTKPELSPPATYEWPLQRRPKVRNVTGGGFWRSSPVCLRHLEKKNYCHAIRGTIEVAPPQTCFPCRSLGERWTSLACLPSFIMLQCWPGPVLALHRVLFKRELSV